MTTSITVHDVARAAGVSASTVSRALSGNTAVATRTRQRVVDAARHLGYQPNVAARGLITGTTHNIGLLVPDLGNPYFAAITKSVQSRALAAGYSVFIADSDEDTRTESELSHRLSKQVDGLVLCSPRMPASDLAAIADRTTMVLINREWEGLASVIIDDAEIVRLALEHLHALGHRKVAYVGGPETSWSHQRRWAAIERFAPTFGDLEVSKVGSCAPDFDGGQSAADVVVACGATAALAYNDLVGLGLLARLHVRGIRVPEELSVMGIDDVNVAALVSPGLTTVRSPLKQVGRRAVDELVDLMTATDRHGFTEDLPVRLVVRQSTSVPPHH